jgi:hypothetical protein
MDKMNPTISGEGSMKQEQNTSPLLRRLRVLLVAWLLLPLVACNFIPSRFTITPPQINVHDLIITVKVKIMREYHVFV